MLKVNIIVYELKSWIFNKFAQEIEKNLKILNFDVVITNDCMINQDIYIHFDLPQVDRSLLVKKSASKHLIIFTHTLKKKDFRKLIDINTYENCMVATMSNYAMKYLQKMVFYPNRICCILPPSNEEIFKPDKIKIGIFSAWYADGRKREKMLLTALSNLHSRGINLKNLELVIYGHDWDQIISKLEIFGLSVKNINTKFNVVEYRQTMETVDYYMYLGHDEGSMSFLDAIALNKKIIATPQGFQHDLRLLIDYPINSVQDLIKVFEIIDRKSNLRKSIVDRNWYDYTKNCVEIINETNNFRKLSKLNGKLMGIKVKCMFNWAIWKLNGSISQL